MPVLQSIERWCYHHALDAHVLRFYRGQVSAIVAMTGVCYHCLREHRENNWVLIATPGYSTIRVRCHSTGKSDSLKAPFVDDLLKLM